MLLIVVAAAGAIGLWNDVLLLLQLLFFFAGANVTVVEDYLVLPLRSVLFRYVVFASPTKTIKQTTRTVDKRLIVFKPAAKVQCFQICFYLCRL